MSKFKILVIFTSLIIFLGCNNNDNNVIDKYENRSLISANLITSYSAQQTKSLISIAESQLESSLNLSNIPISGFKVYYVEYKSEYIDKESVTLSGLVCISDNKSRPSTILT